MEALERNSVVLLEQLRTVDKQRLTDSVGDWGAYFKFILSCRIIQNRDFDCVKREIDYYTGGVGKSDG